MRKFTAINTFMLALGMAAMSTGGAYAAWGNQNKSEIVYEKQGEILQFHTARTSDGYTYMAWLEWNEDWSPAASLMLCMQLLDPDGNTCWGDDGLVIDGYPTRSFTSANSLVVDSEGNAYVSWADSRSQIDKVLREDDERYDNFEPVIYKINKEGEMLWGEDGKTYDMQTYSMCPVLYQAGDNLYATIYGIGYGSFIASYFVRLDPETGDFIGSPKSMTGQYIGSVGTDIIRVYASGSSTVAMRYDENLNTVWSEPAVVAPYVYEGHNNFPYNLVSDYQGGVIVSFDRNLASSKWMPVVNYITADGESTFGSAVDVTTITYNNNSYNFMVYNPQTENIFNVWGVSNPTLALYGQLMDIFGERQWGNGEGTELAYKVATMDYSFAPLSAVFTKDDTYWILYVDENNWLQDTMYLICVDEEGNIVEGVDEDNDNTIKVGPYYQAIESPKVYWEDGNLYIIYYNHVTSTGLYRIRTVMMEDVYEPGEIPAPVEPGESGIGTVETTDAAVAAYYSLDGLRLASPRKGINLVKYSDGTVKKVIVN